MFDRLIAKLVGFTLSFFKVARCPRRKLTRWRAAEESGVPKVSLNAIRHRDYG